MLKKITLFTFLLFACGSGDEGLVEKITYKLTETSVNLDVEFNSTLELDVETIIPIKKFGRIKFSPGNSGRGFLLGFELDYKILEDEEIAKVSKTRLLPNGQRMSRYINEDLLWIHFKKKNKIRPSLYLGSSFDNFYLGTSLELSFIGEEFPEMFPTITFWSRDSKGRVLGVVTFYGPKIVDGEVKVPGGIFFVTNVTHLISYAKEDADQGSDFVSRDENGTMEGSFPAFAQGDYEATVDGKPVELSNRTLWKIAKKIKEAVDEYNEEMKDQKKTKIKKKKKK